MRVLSLSDSATAWLSAFGGSDMLIETDLLPDDGPFSSVGSAVLPHDQLVAILNENSVDLLVTEYASNTVQRTSQVTDVLVFRPTSFKTMLDAALELARRVGLLPEAMQWIARREAELAAMRRERGLDRRSSAADSAVLVTGVAPLRSGGYWCADVLELAGMQPLLTGRSEAPRPIDTEALREASPDFVLVPEAVDLDQIVAPSDDLRERMRMLRGDVLHAGPGLYEVVFEIAGLARSTASDS